MSIDFINAWAFSFHLILLCVKLYVLNVIFSLFMLNKSPSANSYMLVFKRFEVYIFAFTMMVTLFEAYFLFCFFLNLDLYLYEYLSVLDQIALSLLVTYFIVKGEKSNGKSKN